MKIMIKTLVCAGSFVLAGHVYAACTQSQNEWVVFENQPSIDISEGKFTAQKFNSGLKCDGLASVTSRTHMRYLVSSVPSVLRNSETGETLNIHFRDDDNHSVNAGVTNDLSKTAIFSIFSGPEGSIPFSAFVDAGQIISPGIYNSTVQFRLKWYYSVPVLAAGPFGFFDNSPGFRRGVGDRVISWGSGVDSTTHFRITIKPDCRISVQDVNLGTAAFANQLEQVYTDVGVRCSARTPYSVAINDGSHSNGGQRRLKSTSSNHYINYDIYKNFYDQRWGSTGAQPWISDHATNNGGIYDGRAIQIFKMRTKVTPNNPDNLPGGQYTDKLIMQIIF